MKTSRTFGVLFAIVAVFSLSLAFRPDKSVLSRPLTDDAFYAFSISHNLAQGNGVTIDGATLTNGFQPLYVFLCAPLFALAGQNLILAVRLAIALSWLMYIGAGFLIGQVVQDLFEATDKHKTSWICWSTAALYISAPIVFLMCFCGLETGCLLFVYALCWRYYQIGLEDTHKHWILFGSLLGILVLARIDAVFFVVLVSASQLLQRRNPRFSDKVVRFLEVSIPAFLVSSPWWLYNAIVFHSLMPSSGKAEQAWELSYDRLDRMYAVLTRDLIPWAYLTESHADWTFGVLLRSLVLLLLAAAAIKYRRNLKRTFISVTSTSSSSRRTLEFARWLVVTGLILAVWYGLSSWAMHFYTRYLMPLSLVATFVAAISAVLAYRKAPKLVTIVLSILAIPTLAGIAILWSPHNSFVGNLMLQEQVTLVEKYVPSAEVVAAGQSGTLGYLRQNVVNLDGKVNPRALQYQSKMWEYLPQVHATWICDWPSYIHKYLGDHPEEHGWRFIARDGDFDLYQYQGAGEGTAK